MTDTTSIQRRGVRLIALELTVGVFFAMSYLTLIRPAAPRAAAKPAPTVAEATVVAPPVEVVPAPLPPEPAPAPAPLAVPTPAPMRKTTAPRPAAAPKQAPPPPAVERHAPVPVMAETRASLTPTLTPARPTPSSPEDLIRRGMTSLNARDWPLALEAFDAARRMQPANPDLGYLRGMALENLGQPGAAIDAYQSCTAGPYASVAKAHVKLLVTKLRGK